METRKPYSTGVSDEERAFVTSDYRCTEVQDADLHRIQRQYEGYR